MNGPFSTYFSTNWNAIGVLGGKKIGIPGVLEAKDIANPNVEYLGVMAWVAQFQWIPDKTPPSERLEMRCNLNKIKVGEEVRLIYDTIWYWHFYRIFGAKMVREPHIF